VHFAHDQRRIEPRIERARAALGEAQFGQLWAEGARRTLADALAAAGVPPAASPAPELATTPAAPPASPLEVRALGPLAIVRAGVPLTTADWNHARPRELFLYLLSHPDGRTRDQIGLVFWPDSSAAQVKNSFHVTLYHLRKALGRPDWVVFEHDRYRINTALGIDYDAARFEAGTSEALRRLRRGEDVAPQLAELLPLYRGEFLEDEAAGDWHLEHRDRLRQLYLRALRAVGAAHLQAGAWAAAAEFFERLLRVDDLDEEAHRNLMTCIARGGERGRALRHYERLVVHLREELGAQPEPATVALFRRLQQAEPA
jgi:DNA-binding SARP family transcriptional activator